MRKQSKSFRSYLLLLIVLTICFLCACSNDKCHHQIVIDNFVLPTCEHKGITQGEHCSLCGEIIIPQHELASLGHSWEAKDIIGATEFQEGLVKYHCSRCAKEKEEVLPKREHIHQYIHHNSMEATCEQDGCIEYYECVCGKYFVYTDNQYIEVESQNIVISKTGHDISRVRETEIPHFEYEQCSNCGHPFDYVLPTISIVCNDEIGLDYSCCEVSTDNCLEACILNNIPAQIKIRGNWTSTLDKKPYRIKFDKKQSMLGLNEGLKAKSWVLLADYADKSMVRNAVAFYIANKVYGNEYYSSDCCFVEVYINGEFQGIYLLAEQQQINEGRVNIFEDKNYPGTDIGYFFEYDQYFWKEDPSIVFEIDYDEVPYFNGFAADDSHFIKQYVVKNDLNNESQREYIKNRIQSIWNVAYNALYCDHSNLSVNPYKTINDSGEIIDDLSIHGSYDALNKIIDINSLVDTYLFNEIIQDMDIGYSSFYLSLDMGEFGNKKLTFQAPWDFDWCFGNSVNNIHQLYVGNYLETEPNHQKSNPWLLLVSNEQWFWELMKEKWFLLSESGLQEAAICLVSSFSEHYSEYVKREYDRWPEKVNLLVWCSSENTLSAKTQQEDSANVKNYINRRFGWLNYYFRDLRRVKPNFLGIN